MFRSNQYCGNNVTNAVKVGTQYLTYAMLDFGLAAHFSCLNLTRGQQLNFKGDLGLLLGADLPMFGSVYRSRT